MQKTGILSLVKKLASNVGEYKKQTLLTPLFVTFEVIFDVLIPYIMTKLLTVIETVMVLGSVNLLELSSMFTFSESFAASADPVTRRISAMQSASASHSRFLLILFRSSGSFLLPPANVFAGPAI